MMAEQLVSRLDSVRRIGIDRWLACCPAHDDKRPSLSVRETDDRVLVHCWTGCSVREVLSAVGLELDALFPPRDTHRGKPERRPWPASDVLRALEGEALIVAVAALMLRNGVELTQQDRERLLVASSRLTVGVQESAHG